MKHALRILALAIALLLPLGAPVAADQFEDGEDAYDSGDFATALELWRPLAEAGDAYAQYMLGVMYENAEGVPQDYAEAVAWYRLAADQEFPDALNSLGIMYAEGLGVPQDYVQAYMWFSIVGADENRDRAASLMTPEQLAEAERLAQEWKPKTP